MKIALDLGHRGKISMPNDNGATSTLPSGEVIVEADLAQEYLSAAALSLTAQGHQVYLSDKDKGILTGEYHTRQKQANDWGVDCYMQGHLNSGGGKYSLIKVHHAAGPRTLELAFILSQLWQEKLPVFQAQVWGVNDSGSSFRIYPGGRRENFPGDESRGFSALKYLRPPGLLLEPLFIDKAEHQKFIREQDGLKTIAQTLVEALKQWADKKPGAA